MTAGGAHGGGYALGIDLGTTYTAAATATGETVEMVAFGHRTTSLPSVVYMGDDGEVLIGDAANRRAVSEPARVAREFKRRVGDPVPVMVGGRPMSTELLISELLSAVVKDVATERAAAATSVVLTHPANWGAYKQDVLFEAARLAGLGAIGTVSEPEAAATWYANQARVAEGATIAVYDLGGGTFDAAVLRRTASGFDLLDEPRGIDRLGGIDFDEAVFRFVVESASVNIESLDADDPAIVAALAQLRRDCVDAKEALSSDTATMVNVFVPGRNFSVRITRGELEHLIGPLVDRTVTALAQAIQGAGLTPEAVDAVLLVGGSSRVPLVGRRVTESLGVPVTLDAHPKHSVALGAALVASGALAQSEAAPVTAVIAPWPDAPAAAPPAAIAPVAPGPPPVLASPRVGRDGSRSRVGVIVGVGAVAAAAGIVGALLLTRGGGGGGSSAQPLPFGYVNRQTNACTDTSTGLAVGAVVKDGTLLVTDREAHVVTAVDPAGNVSRFAGNGVEGTVGDGRSAAAGQLESPQGLAIDSSGAVYVADFTTGRVRSIAPDGTFDTVVGSATATNRADGTKASEFKMNGPSGVAVSPDGLLYVAALVDHKVVRVEREGVVKTVLGTPEGGAPIGRTLNDPGALAFDRAGNLYVADQHEVLRLAPDGTVTTFAGGNVPGHDGDGGAAASAQLCDPEGIVADDRGNVYIAEEGNDIVRGVGTDGRALTFAGSTNHDSNIDSTQPSDLPLFSPQGVTIDSNGDLYVADRAELFAIDSAGHSRHVGTYKTAG